MHRAVERARQRTSTGTTTTTATTTATTTHNNFDNSNTTTTTTTITITMNSNDTTNTTNTAAAAAAAGNGAAGAGAATTTATTSTTITTPTTNHLIHVAVVVCIPPRKERVGKFGHEQHKVVLVRQQHLAARRLRNNSPEGNNSPEIMLRVAFYPMHHEHHARASPGRDSRREVRKHLQEKCKTAAVDGSRESVQCLL